MNTSSGSRTLTRDAEFDRHIDENNSVVVESMPIVASDALATDATAYDAALQAWRQQRREELIQRVLEDFPQPIALRFHRYHRGAQKAREKIDHLRDTWEAVTIVYAALLIAEVRGAEVHGQTGRCPALGLDPGRIAFHNLRDPIDIVARILGSDFDLRATAFLKAQDRARLVEVMGLLNSERNGLAHKETPPEPECRRRLEICEPLVFDVLRILEPLTGCTVASYFDIEEGVTFQIYRGKGTERELETRPVTPAVKSTILTLHDPKAHVIVLWDEEVFSLSPLIRWYDSGRGHQPLLAFLDDVSTRDGNLRYQTFGTTETFDTSSAKDVGFDRHIGRHSSGLLAEHELLRSLFRVKGGRAVAPRGRHGERDTASIAPVRMRLVK